MEDLVARLRASIKACRALDRSALLAEAADAIERLGLTDAEREVIEWAVRAMRPECRAVLQRLLERLSPQTYQETDEKRGVSDTQSLMPGHKA